MQPISWHATPVSKSKQPVFDEQNDTVIRQSTIGQYFLCGGRVGLQDEEGTLQAVSEPLVFGTCTHHIIAETLLTGEPRLDLLANMGDWVEQILVEDYDWSLDKIDSPIEFFSELGVAYRTWLNQVQPKITDILAIEQEMWLYLGPGARGNIWLRGTPDIVTAPRLRDTKTSGRGWKQDKADLSIQASLYPALVKQNLDKSIRDFYFDSYDRSKSKWTTLKTSRTIEQIDSALNTAYRYGLQLESGQFSYTPVPEAGFNKKRGWYCSPKYCEAWNICPGKYLADGVDEQTVAIRSWK